MEGASLRVRLGDGRVATFPVGGTEPGSAAIRAAGFWRLNGVWVKGAAGATWYSPHKIDSVEIIGFDCGPSGLGAFVCVEEVAAPTLTLPEPALPVQGTPIEPSPAPRRPGRPRKDPYSEVQGQT